MEAKDQNTKTEIPTMYCRKCQYILNNLANNICPECGQAYDPDDEKTFYTSIPIKYPKWTIFWIVLACWGYATGGEVLWRYYFPGISPQPPHMYYFLWFSFWLFLAVFATIHAVRLFGNQRLHTAWFKQRGFRITTRISKALWLLAIIYCVAAGPMAAAHTGRYTHYNLFTFLYRPVFALGSSKIITIDLMFQYMNTCSDPIGKMMWKKSLAHEKQGEYQKALDAISHFINPRAAKRKACLYYKLSDYRAALYYSYYSGTNNPDDFVFRAHIYQELGKYESAIGENREAIRRQPDLMLAHNNLAWILATCPNEQYRDSQKAIEHATKACEITQWENTSCIGTLAAAYAESGEFEKAVEMLIKAIELAPEHEIELRQNMMDCFEKHQPYRVSNNNK